LGLATLVAQGRANAQIAAQLYISIRTVSSHLDRIRDKTGCRRRADLTRLALSARLVQPGPAACLLRVSARGACGHLTSAAATRERGHLAPARVKPDGRTCYKKNGHGIRKG